MNLVQKAGVFQRAAHGAVGQVRKFSGLPYHVHPEAVLGILCQNVPGVTEAMMCATLLHDVLEDTDVTDALLCEEFGPVVTGMVLGLTKWMPTPGTFGMSMNRAARHKLTVRRLKLQSPEVKTIKLADILHNLPDIIENDPKHAVVYVAEKREMLDVALKEGNQLIWMKVDAVIQRYYLLNPQENPQKVLDAA